MKPVFKQINDKLYIELDNPVYLTEQSFREYNKHGLGCVVRLIQDDSQMGERNKLRFTNETLADIDIMLGIDKFVQATFESFVGFNIYCYEIIGYIIRPNSAEWALWQMMNSKKVTHKLEYGNLDWYCYIKNGGVWHSVFGGCVDYTKWFTTECYKDGWEIYKPEPSKPEYKIGDWVEHNDSKEQAQITHIASKNYDAIEVKFFESGELEVYSLVEMNKEFHAINPKEVVLDFGSGIKGVVMQDPCEPDTNPCEPDTIYVIYGCFTRGEYHLIDINPLTEPMKTIVIELLKAQEEA